MTDKQCDEHLSHWSLAYNRPESASPSKNAKAIFFLMQRIENLKCETPTTAEDLDRGAVRGTSPGEQKGSPYALISTCTNYSSLLVLMEGLEKEASSSFSLTWRTTRVHAPPHTQGTLEHSLTHWVKPGGSCSAWNSPLSRAPRCSPAHRCSFQLAPKSS